jgi:tripartite-type tricarboxylate transporter receptor subunit TctC
VPLVGDYVKTDEARRLIKYGIQDTAVITRPYFLSPGTPKNPVQLLRKAFADTLKDPELLAEAKKG